MAEAYGGGPNPPVQLDPFQNIVNVHWASPFLVVGYGLTLDLTAQGERGIGPGPPLVEPFSEGFVTEAVPSYGSDPPSVEIWTGGQWVDVEPDEITLSAAPELPGAYSFEAWEVQGITAPIGLQAPIIRFIEESGTPPDINLPDAHLYITALIANGEVVAQDFISEPQPLPIGGDVPLWATYNPALVQKDTFSISVADLTATYKDRTYLPIATRVSGGALAVLMQRQALPPSP